jgi:hypothetical protein
MALLTPWFVASPQFLCREALSCQGRVSLWRPDMTVENFGLTVVRMPLANLIRSERLSSLRAADIVASEITRPRKLSGQESIFDVRFLFPQIQEHA